MNAEVFARRQEIFESALSVIREGLPEVLERAASASTSPRRSLSASAGRGPLLYSASGSPLPPTGGIPAAPLPDSYYSYRRSAASREGSMKNWVPRKLFWKPTEQLEREQIFERAIDLANNDPNAAGLIDRFATSVIGPGLTPHPNIDADAAGIDADAATALQKKQLAAHQRWEPVADAGERQDMGAIQYAMERSLIQFGEYLLMLPMLEDASRPYSLAVQLIHPLRLKTPVDLWMRPDIKDGVEMGPYGQPVAYWIKKSVFLTGGMSNIIDVSSNFLRVPARVAHRWCVLHGFIHRSPEQTRGWPFFAPAMKMFRDLDDLMDAELVSSIVTAAFSLFIELVPGSNPWDEAMKQSSFGETVADPYGRHDRIHYQELIPGAIMYGQTGEKASPIKADRPGTTFEPFTRLVKKAIALSVNLPYAVGFLDTDQVNYAGYRSAMLEAWRTYTHHRVFVGRGLQKIWTMLQEEAFLKGDLGDVPDFYKNMAALTRTSWRGYPKGDIEPLKAVQADILAIQNNLKTRAESIMERGGELLPTFDRLSQEQEEMAERRLYDGPILSVPGESKQQVGAAEGKGIGPSKPEAVPLTDGPAANPASPPAEPDGAGGARGSDTAVLLLAMQNRIEEIWDAIETMRQETPL
jgi:lambda family phage portal protein